jgi:hypothetical protein
MDGLAEMLVRGERCPELFGEISPLAGNRYPAAHRSVDAAD